MREDDELTQRCRARVGDILGEGVRLEALVGVGGMAAVYAATDPMGTMCAVKVLHPEIAAMPDARQRFLREAAIASTLGCPGTVAVQAVGEGDGEAFLVMEFLFGETVDARAEKRGGRLPADEVLWIADETLAVLELAHAKAVIHRDIKPENLFVTQKRVLKVLDFGIARLRETEAARSLAMTRTGMAMGTPAFMAPEQALGRWADVDGRTDLWAVGATMFTLLTGQFVHPGETLNEVMVHAATSPARSLARLLPEAPIGLVHLVDRALAYDRQERFPNATSMREALRAVREGTREAPAPEPKKRASVTPPPRALPRGDVAYDATIPLTPAQAPAPKGNPPLPPRAVAPRELTGEPPSTPPTVRIDSIPPAALTGASPVGTEPLVPPPATELRSPVGPGTRFRGRSARDAVVYSGFERVDLASMSPAQIAALRELFTMLGRTFVAQVQYGHAHAETTRRLDRVWAAANAALELAGAGIVWQVSPYSFHVADETVWEPEPPHDRVPYALFSAGVRELALTKGLLREELVELLRLLTLDPVTEIPPEDDISTLLWDACFEHVLVHAIDAFAEGDQLARAAFERQVQAVVDDVKRDDSDLLEGAHRDALRGGGGELGVAPVARIAAAIAESRGLEADAVARAQTVVMRVTQGDVPAGAARELLDVDEATRRVLALRFDGDPADIGERFVVAAASAVDSAELVGRAEPLLHTLGSAVERLLSQAPPQGLAFVHALCTAVPASSRNLQHLRARIASATLTPTALKPVLELLVGAPTEELLDALAAISSWLDATHLASALEVLPRTPPGRGRELLLGLVRAQLPGNEITIAGLFAKADIELGLALVRILVEAQSAGAREAVLRAVESPHPVVRIEGLGHVEGQSSERLRKELRALVEDSDPKVRLAALAAMATHRIKVAGPFLALRIRSPGFDELPLEERRAALDTVSRLTEARAEALALELLDGGGLIKRESREQTRALAAELLGRIATSDEAKKALETARGQRFFASREVREAAARALEAGAARGKWGGSS